MRLIDADKLETHEIFDGVEWNVIVYKDDIDAQPTIDAELVKHGMWIEHTVDDDGLHFHKCSVCGTWDMPQGIFIDEYNKRHTSFHYLRHYCPYCGARMENDV